MSDIVVLLETLSHFSLIGIVTALTVITVLKAVLLIFFLLL